MKLNAATSIASEYTLHDQPSAKNLLYRVVAINKAGEGIPSNTVNVSFSQLRTTNYWLVVF